MGPDGRFMQMTFEQPGIDETITQPEGNTTPKLEESIIATTLQMSLTDLSPLYEKKKEVDLQPTRTMTMGNQPKIAGREYDRGTSGRSHTIN